MRKSLMFAAARFTRGQCRRVHQLPDGFDSINGSEQSDPASRRVSCSRLCRPRSSGNRRARPRSTPVSSMQQCQGVGGRFVQAQSNYNFSNIPMNSDYAAVYGAGGLLDIRTIEARSDTAGDLQFKGIAEVWEALVIGTAADMCGDIPYRDAAGADAHPTFDPQLQVYDDIEAKLDQGDHRSRRRGAGAWTRTTSSTAAMSRNGLQPRIRSRHATICTWWRFAGTRNIKRRSMPRPTESRRTTAISAPFHTTATFERNVWYQFQSSIGFGDDLAAGLTLVNIMNAQDDPRRAKYFNTNSAGSYGGVGTNGSCRARRRVSAQGDGL